MEVNQPHGWEEKQLMTFFVLKLKVKARSKVAALSELIYFVDGEPLCFFFFYFSRADSSVNGCVPTTRSDFKFGLGLALLSSYSLSLF